jgi:hypothetical protein
MGRERPDMFDVASGECELVDFLLTRFDPIDLKTKIKFDPTANVDEQLAPNKEEEEAAPLVPDKPAPEPVALQLDLKMPPPPGSSAPAAASDPADGFKAAAPEVEVVDEADQAELPSEEVEEAAPPAAEVPVIPMGPDWLALTQRFLEASQRYQEELGTTKDKKDEST